MRRADRERLAEDRKRLAADRKQVAKDRKRIAEDRKRLADRRESARRRAINVLVILAAQVILGIMALTTAPEDAAYAKVHFGVFIVSCFSILAFFAVLLFVDDATLTTMLRHAWRAALRPGQATLPEVVDALVMLSLVVALASLAFIVDLTFFRGGFQIGGTLAVTLYLVVKAFVEGLRATRR